MKKSSTIIIIILFISNISIGCLEYFENINEDPIILRAKPYIDKIEVNNSFIKNYAYSIIKNINDSREHLINTVYRFIVDNFQYIEDPAEIELIKTPLETINDKGGDCEDLTILLNSLLENIDIKTFIVMNETHAYSLVCDVDINIIWKEIENSFIGIIEDKWGEKIYSVYNDTFILKSKEIWYYGGNGSYFNNYIDYLNISYDILSDYPVNLYLVPSSSDFENLSNDKEFYQYMEYQEINMIDIINKLSYIQRFGGIILQNNKNKDTEIKANITFYFRPNFYEYYKNNSIKSYNIKNKNCIVIDCTVGEWGYPGYDTGIKGEKIAYSSTNYEYFYLYD